MDELERHCRRYRFGAAIAADPDACVDKLRPMKRRFGLTEFALWFNIGGNDPAQCERAKRIVAGCALPHVWAAP